MAVKAELNSKSYSIKYKTGVNSKNQDVFSTLKFSKISSTATDQAFYNTARAIETIMDFELNDIQRNESYSIVETQA